MIRQGPLNETEALFRQTALNETACFAEPRFAEAQLGPNTLFRVYHVKRFQFHTPLAKKSKP